MGEIILLKDHKATLGKCISPNLLTRHMKQVVAEIIATANRKKLVGHPDLSEVAGELVGYSIVRPERDDCSGWCDMWTKKIAIHPDDSIASQQITLCHEMGHAIQALVGHYDSISYLLSDLMRDEQQAETMSAMLVRELFPATQLGSRKFNYGFRPKDAVFLNDWFVGLVENDLYTVNDNTY